MCVCVCVKAKASIYLCKGIEKTHFFLSISVRSLWAVGLASLPPLLFLTFFTAFPNAYLPFCFPVSFTEEVSKCACLGFLSTLQNFPTQNLVPEEAEKPRGFSWGGWGSDGGLVLGKGCLVWCWGLGPLSGCLTLWFMPSPAVGSLPCALHTLTLQQSMAQELAASCLPRNWPPRGPSIFHPCSCFDSLSALFTSRERGL